MLNILIITLQIEFFLNTTFKKLSIVKLIMHDCLSNRYKQCIFSKELFFIINHEFM